MCKNIAKIIIIIIPKLIIRIQTYDRSVPEAWKNMHVDDDITPLVETLQQLRAQHIGTLP
jgi:hypothetical protein